MIGNDIIDLQTASMESNWRRPNYLSKIFTPAEQELICNSNNPDQTVWWLWSAKEAVYKIVNRQTLQRRYAPLSFTYLTEDSFLHEGEKYFIQSEITRAFIHTIAVTHPDLFPQLEVITDPCTPYDKDENKLPMIANQPVSISHHGRYWAMVKLKTLFT
jgi:phosphopantetheinyl transferase (holo-ACP synthase)